MKKGKVFLVGGGPGDPELLTLKARRVLGLADLVVYDYLVNPELLGCVSKRARKIGVGKGFRFKKLSQDKINALILSEARKGHQVVRLKGGDPYLFARGGEEALFLSERNIPFEVVPGVTSATACAAYAGIPLTHRAFNASVTFLTGHRADDAALDSVAWDKIVALKGTIVIYMGFYNLGIIAERLLEAGAPADTKAAVIEWGSLPRQKSCAGTLGTIERLSREKGLKAPAIILIGEVVSLRERLNWYERLPLFGKTVLVTRMRDKAGVLSDKLRALGADVIECPVIAIERAAPGPIDRAIRRLKEFDWLVFTSAYGVDGFFTRLRVMGRDARALGSVKIAVVGPQTRAALAAYGVRADVEPKNFESASLIPALRKRERLVGKRCLLMRTHIALPELERGLRRAGARPEAVAAYRTVRVRKIPAKAKEALRSGGVDWLTFTSASTVDNLRALIGKKEFMRTAHLAKIASIGPVTTRALRRAGLRPTVQARPYTMDGLVEAMGRAR